MIPNSGTKIILVAMLLASITVNIIQSLLSMSKSAVIEQLEARPASGILDSAFVTKASSIWAKKNGTTISQAMEGRYAKTMHLEREVCVSLNMEIGGVGGAPVYCFDSRTGVLTRAYDDVE